MDEKESTDENGEEQYELVFKNGALANLKSLAKRFNVPENDLKQVVSKGIKLLGIVKDAKQLTLEDRNGERFIVDIEKL